MEIEMKKFIDFVMYTGLADFEKAQEFLFAKGYKWWSIGKVLKTKEYISTGDKTCIHADKRGILFFDNIEFYKSSGYEIYYLGKNPLSKLELE